MTLASLRSSSPWLAALDDRCIALLDPLGKEEAFSKGDILFRADGIADRFYVVASGTVALLFAGPSRPPITIQTVGRGGLLGLSWRLAPHRWQWTAKAIDDVTALRFNALDVRTMCQEHPELDGVLLEVVAQEAARRLQNVRMQLLDLYGRT
ncbi:MAG TPA: cyclic nucleotide-binding domain-containing protein [Acidimicrobiia bacterium]|nr:cyclic nucleotide-binding domain-containing protein [Acidimicrobiia bacterium]